jgi:hypothetical protein
MPERVTVKRASELTGMSELSMRLGIQNGFFNFGTALHNSKHRTNYHICPVKLAEYLGISVEQVKGKNH